MYIYIYIHTHTYIKHIRAESIREANPQVNYIEATVSEIVPSENKLVCESVMCEGASCSIEEFSLNYDTLVVAVGASVNTFG